jgi:hypothetical protein
MRRDSPGTMMKAAIAAVAVFALAAMDVKAQYPQGSSYIRKQSVPVDNGCVNNLQL